MKLKLTESQSKYINKPIKTAEKQNEWSWWFLFGAVVIMEVVVILKITGII